MVFFIVLLLFIIILTAIIMIFLLKKSKNLEKYTGDNYTFGKTDSCYTQSRYFTIEALSLKLVILPMLVAFIAGSVFFGIIFIIETETPVLSDIGKEIINNYSVLFVQFIVFQMMFFSLYALFKRIKITVENGTVYINNVIQDIRYYQIRKIFVDSNLLYLKTEKKLWILLPFAPESFRKYKRKEILREQNEEINRNVAIIEKILVNSDAEYKIFKSIRNLFIIFGGVFILCTIILFGMFVIKYY